MAKLEDAERTRMRLEAEVSAGLIEGGRMTRELMTAQVLTVFICSTVHINEFFDCIECCADSVQCDER